METRKNVSYIFIPFRFASKGDFRNLMSAIKSSGNWIHEDIDVKYMLKYVADKIKANTEDSRQCYQFRISDEARRLYGLPGADEWCSTQEYKFNDAPVKARFHLEDIKMFCFRTSIGIMAFRISFENDDPFWVSNALFELKKAGRTKFSMGESSRMRTLLGISRVITREFIDVSPFEFFFYSYKGKERAHVLVFLQAEEQEDFSKELFYLRRCYASSYKYRKNEKKDEAELHSPSRGMNWGVSPEAAVCIACPDAGIGGFLENTFFKNFNSQYLLMFALLLHQKYVLYMFLTDIGNSDRNDLATLEKYKNELYEYETDFVFSNITEVPQYQELYDKISQAFALKDMYEDVHEPILSLGEVRRSADEKEEAKRSHRLNIILGLISVLSIFSALVDSFDFIEKASDSFFGTPDSAIRIIQICVTLIILALTVGAFIWYRATKKSPGSSDNIGKVNIEMKRKKPSYQYIGCFFDEETEKMLREHRQGKELAKSIKYLHTTIEYQPKYIGRIPELFGKEIEVTVTGYGNNGRNEGLEVKVSSKNEEIQEMLERIEVPHITLSRAEDAQSVDTRYLEFEPIEPFTVKGVFGGYADNNGPVTRAAE